MRNITCAHLVADADAPVRSAQEIRIVDDRAAAAGGARPSPVGPGAKPLEAWLNYLALFPSVDPYLAAAVSLATSALGGVGTVMVHYTRAQGFTDLPAEAAEVARAARDVGVRVGFAVAMRDRNPLVYGPSEPILATLPPDARKTIDSIMRTPLAAKAFITLVDEVAAA